MYFAMLWGWGPIWGRQKPLGPAWGELQTDQKPIHFLTTILTRKSTPTGHRSDPPAGTQRLRVEEAPGQAHQARRHGNSQLAKWAEKCELGLISTPFFDTKPTRLFTWVGDPLLGPRCTEYNAARAD